MLIDSLIVLAVLDPPSYYLEVMLGGGVTCVDAMMVYR